MHTVTNPWRQLLALRTAESQSLPHEREVEGREEEMRGRGSSGSLLVPELIGHPVQSFIEPVPTGGTGGQDVPVPVA
jgi:hypothetical protein